MDPATLIEFRIKEGLSQRAAAERLGINLRTWQDWEQGRRRPSGKAWTRLQPILCCASTPAGAEQKPFADALRLYRKWTRQTQPEAAATLSERTGAKISVAALRDWEQRRRVPSADAMRRVLPVINAAAEAEKKSVGRFPRRKWRRRRERPFDARNYQNKVWHPLDYDHLPKYLSRELRREIDKEIQLLIKIQQKKYAVEAAEKARELAEKAKRQKESPLCALFRVGS